MTRQTFKHLKLGAIIRRIGEEEEYMVLVTNAGDVRTIYPKCQEVTDPENWELVRTAHEEARRYRQWEKEVWADNAEDNEESD